MNNNKVPMLVTPDEALFLLNQRRLAEDAEKKRAAFRACPHTNKEDRGRWGHNGDQWWYCLDCKNEWTDD